MPTAFGLLAILSWGLLAVLSTYSKAIAPFQLLALCFLIATLLIYIKRFFKSEKLFIKPQLTSMQWIVGISGLFGFHFCYFMAIRNAPVIEVSLIAYLWPLFLGIYVAPSAYIKRAIFGGILGFVGVANIMQGDFQFDFNNSNVIGYLFALGCAFIWSGYSWFISVNKSRTDDISWITLVSALLALLSHLFLEDSNWSLSAVEWTAVILLGLGPVGGAFYLWEIGMKSGNKTLLASCSFFTPALSALALYIFSLSEFSYEIIAALVLILFGAAITNSRMPLLRFKVR